MELHEVDAFVLGSIDVAPERTFVIVERFRSTYPSYAANADRIVDRALQRLRKSGKIKPAPKQKGWVLA